MLPRRPRLKEFSYLGIHRYFLTFCTHDRCKAFVTAAAVDLAWSQILRAAAETDFAITAHVIMLDHLHMTVEGTTGMSDLRALAHKAKQLSAYEYRRRQRRRLWQPSYWDHVLREDESIMPFVRYILENPVRAGLVESPEQYPYLGAGEMSVPEMLKALAEAGVDAWQPPKARVASVSGQP